MRRLSETILVIDLYSHIYRQQPRAGRSQKLGVFRDTTKGLRIPSVSRLSLLLGWGVMMDGRMDDVTCWFGLAGLAMFFLGLPCLLLWPWLCPYLMPFAVAMFFLGLPGLAIWHAFQGSSWYREREYARSVARYRYLIRDNHAPEQQDMPRREQQDGRSAQEQALLERRRWHIADCIPEKIGDVHVLMVHREVIEGSCWLCQQLHTHMIAGRYHDGGGCAHLELPQDKPSEDTSDTYCYPWHNTKRIYLLPGDVIRS